MKFKELLNKIFTRKELIMNKNEELVKLYFRLNGYFLVDNFIVHNGSADISNSIIKIIPPSTEIDLLGIRLPFQSEIAGGLDIENCKKLTLEHPLIDLVIVESKSGKENRPNPTWRSDKYIENINYLIRFMGISDESEVVKDIANNLIQHFHYEWRGYSIRYIIVSENINKYYSDLGVTYILIEEILDFVIKIRGECWIKSNMGIASYHPQWNPFMNEIFKIANDREITEKDKKLSIRNYLKD